MTIKDVAGHLCVSWDVVKDIKKRYLYKKFAKPKLKHLRQIAIDEISTGKGHRYVTIVLDLEPFEDRCEPARHHAPGNGGRVIRFHVAGGDTTQRGDLRIRRDFDARYGEARYLAQPDRHHFANAGLSLAGSGRLRNRPGRRASRLGAVAGT